MTNVFDALDRPGTSARPSYFGPGTYDLTITTLRHQDSKDPKQPRGTKIFVAEFRIAACEAAGAAPGDTRAWVCVIEPTEQGDRSVADIKCLICAAAGVDPSNADAVAAFEARIRASGSTFGQLFAQVTGAMNPFAGKPVRLVATSKLTRAGKPFTVHAWAPAVVAAAGV